MAEPVTGVKISENRRRRNPSSLRFSSTGNLPLVLEDVCDTFAAIMLKPLAILGAGLFCTGIMAGQPNQSASVKNQSSAQPPVLVENSTNKQAKANGNTPAGNTAVQQSHWWSDSNWWLVIVAAGTAGVIGWQSWETRKAAEATLDAAKAALLQATHMVTSERAWMVAEAVDAEIPPEIEGATGIRWTGFSVRFVNKGKTPAFLLEVGYCGKVLPHEQMLPAIQPPYEGKETSKWDGAGLPLLPGADVRKNHLGTWAIDPVKIARGFDVLWVYGYLKYGDAFGVARETWYCYRWVHEIERYQSSGFIAGGPESYNRAT